MISFNTQSSTELNAIF